jgi:hypothetical protein
MPGSPLITLSGGGFWQSGLDWICRSDALPVSCGKVVEGAQLSLVLLQRGLSGPPTHIPYSFLGCVSVPS